MPAFEVVSLRNALLCTFAAVICFSFTPASAQEAITTPILSSAPNFRDLAGISRSNGGTGFADTTSNNGVMRTGVFYRTNALSSLTNADWTTLSSMHIDRDIDLRTPYEIYGYSGPQPPDDVAPAQDRVLAGATWTNVNIYGTWMPVPNPYTAAPAQAATFMQEGYKDFVRDPNQRNGFRTVLLTLASDPGPDLWHCSGGKDRTGWTSAILQSIAGVSPDTIMKDYLATNSYISASLSLDKAYLLSRYPGANPATIDALLGVQSSYLQAGLDQVVASYGSMYAYLTRGLGLTQADIYVLRAKMVYYSMLPGQSGFVGNSAAGAALLNSLQSSPLSGHYTDYNFYLQSAIDAGTLRGVERRVGGQVHADAASFLLRRPQWIDEAIARYTSGRDLHKGQTRIWQTALGGRFWSDGDTGVAGSTESSAGTIVGATHRFNNQATGSLGVGYNWGSVASAGASANLNTVLGTIGGRYAFSNLEAGPYVTARADVGWVDYQSNRALGENLGTATGGANGAIYSGTFGLGDVFRLAPVTATLQTGVRVSNVNLGSFHESGSDLALGVDSIDKTSSSVLVDMDVRLDPQELYAWTIAPAITLGYERVLGDPRVESTGSLYGFSVSQYSAYDSHDLVKAGLGVTARRDAFVARAAVNGIIGDGLGSAGIGGQLSIGYNF
jgi:protein-tyrosine phosphatase